MRPLTVLWPARQSLRPHIQQQSAQNFVIPVHHQVHKRAKSTSSDPTTEYLARLISAPKTSPWKIAASKSIGLGALTKGPEEEAATAAAIAKAGELTTEGPNEHTIRRYPRQVQALYLKPLRRSPSDGVPCCDLQLRSFSVRNLEFFADFALRAAYYCKLPAFGAHPLPKIRELWTVPKSHFIFKKIQENFVRITHRRLIQIKDGHPESVKLWLAFLRKYQYHGVGMKANVWEWSTLNVAQEMDKNPIQHRGEIHQAFTHMGDTKQVRTVEKVAELLAQERFKLTGGR